MFSQLDHTLCSIAQKVLFISPSRITRSFPTIKLNITSTNAHSYDLEALLDSGATSTYISHSFVENHGIPTRDLTTPLYVYNADNSINKKTITKEAQFTITIQGHKSTEWF